MTVFDNMAYGLRNQGTAKPEIQRRVDEAAGILGLGELLERRPRQLSGGQRQRVAMGRAIVREPAVFLFDEPLSNLDAKLRAQMRLEIKQLQQRLGTTSIYVTHDQVEAMTLGDQLMVMNGGVVEQIGTPLEVYRRPASVFVGGFIGSPAMNFLDARIGEGGALEVGGERLALHAGAGEAGRPVILGLRPEHLQPAPDAAAALALEVGLIEILGADTIAHGRIGGHGGGEGQTAALTVRLDSSIRVEIGERIPLMVEQDNIHLFDSSSQARLPVSGAHG
jgi:sn-glycerol 3-phosphate transport system ATP-binding protein